MVLEAPFALEESAAWRDGRVMAQSRASMLPAHALNPMPGERILDLCGTDATERFQVQHSRNPRSNAQLDDLRIGTLA